MLAASHQVLEHLVDSVDVKQPFVDGRRFNLVGDIAFVVPLFRVPFILVIFGQVVVCNPFTLEFQRYRNRVRWHQELVRDGFGHEDNLCWNLFGEPQ